MQLKVHRETNKLNKIEFLLKSPSFNEKIILFNNLQYKKNLPLACQTH